MANVFLYNIDDLQTIANDYLEQRRSEIARCEQIIEHKAQTLIVRPTNMQTDAQARPAFGHE